MGKMTQALQAALFVCTLRLSCWPCLLQLSLSDCAKTLLARFLCSCLFGLQFHSLRALVGSRRSLEFPRTTCDLCKHWHSGSLQPLWRLPDRKGRANLAAAMPHTRSRKHHLESTTSGCCKSATVTMLWPVLRKGAALNRVQMRCTIAGVTCKRGRCFSCYKRYDLDRSNNAFTNLFNMHKKCCDKN